MAEKAFCIDESLGSRCSPEANGEAFAQLDLYLSLGEKSDRAWGPPPSPAPCFLCCHQGQQEGPLETLADGKKKAELMWTVSWGSLSARKQVNYMLNLNNLLTYCVSHASAFPGVLPGHAQRVWHYWA